MGQWCGVKIEQSFESVDHPLVQYVVWYEEVP